jgi:hypothetical protein
MADSKIIKCAKGGTGKVAKFRVISFGLKLSDNCDRDDDLMLGKSIKRPGVCEQNTSI